MGEGPWHVYHLPDANKVFDDLSQFQQENSIGKLREGFRRTADFFELREVLKIGVAF